MKIKRFLAADMRQAMRDVRAEQGADAVILSTRRLEEGIEIIAAVDYDESLMREAARHGSPAPEAARPPAKEFVFEAPAEAPKKETPRESHKERIERIRESAKETARETLKETAKEIVARDQPNSSSSGTISTLGRPRPRRRPQQRWPRRPPRRRATSPRCSRSSSRACWKPRACAANSAACASCSNNSFPASRGTTWSAAARCAPACCAT